MPKRKPIDDDVMLQILKQYYTEACNSNARFINMREASLYINTHGYPEYSYESLRKNHVAQGYFRTITEAKKSEDFMVLATYSTLNVEEFMKENNTEEKMVTALTKLDSYYYKAAKSGIKIYERNRILLNEKASLTKKLNQETSRNKKLSTRIEELKKSNDNLLEENEALKKYLDEVLYDGAAKKILSESHVHIQNNSINVESEILDKMIITSDIDIVNKLNLSFEEEDDES